MKDKFMLSFFDILKESLLQLMHILGPALFVLLFVGIFMSLFQSITHIQDPGLIFICKFLAFIVYIFFASSSALKICSEMGKGMLNKISIISNI